MHTKTISTIVYVANDGKEFSTLAECLTHEKVLETEIFQHIHMWDDEFFPLVFDSVETAESAFDNATIIEFETEEAADFFISSNDYARDFFLEWPSSGRYYFEPDKNSFLPVSELEKLAAKYRSL